MRGNLKRTNSEDSNDASSIKSGERSLNSYYSERLEQRIMEKTRSNTKMSGGGGGGGSNSNNLGDSMSSFEQRILEKTQRGNNGNPSSSSSSRSNNIRGNASSDPLQSSQRFEQRLAAKAELFSRNDDSLGSKNLDMASSTSTTGSVGSEEGSFEKRLRTKLSASSSSRLAMGDDVREARLLRSSSSGGGNDDVREGQRVASSGGIKSDIGGGDHLAESAQSRKRQAIKSIMQDASLTPQERNARLQSAMRGDWTTTAEDAGERQTSDLSRQDSGTNEEDEGAKFRRVALEAKIASKLKNKARRARYEKKLNDDDDYDDDDSSKDSDEDDELHRPTDDAYRAPSQDDYIDNNNETSRLFADEGQVVGQNGPPAHGSDGVGFGSLPLPEEHFISDRDDPFPDHHSPRHNHEAEEDNMHPGQRITDPTDENFGLAVASAVAPDDEPAYVYNAIEFDPDAKPPLHLNRRFRAYTYLALGMIGSE